VTTITESESPSKALTNPPVTGTPHTPIDLGSIRAEVCERADLNSLALQAGFRRAARQRNAFHCIHGEDRNPSARSYRGRIKCDSCGGSWSPIDLVMLARGCNYVAALRMLAADTGVPWPNLTAGERDQLRRANAAAPQLAREIADWAHGLRLWAEQRKSDLVGAIQFALENDAIDLARHLDRQLAALRPALTIATTNPNHVARAFVELRRSNPGSVERFIAIGRTDREDAELCTAAAVRLIAARQLIDGRSTERVN
jgi:hypothetical protein